MAIQAQARNGGLGGVHNTEVRIHLEAARDQDRALQDLMICHVQDL